MACYLTVDCGLFETLVVEVMPAVGLNYRSVLLANVAFVVFVLGLLPNGWHFLLRHGCFLFEAFDIVNHEVEDDEKK